MTFHIVTLFPEAFKSYFGASILKRALDRGLIQVKLYNIRDFTHDKHRMVDGRPYGGGAGMVLMAEPLLRAVDSILKKLGARRKKTKIILFSAKGKQFNQKVSYDLSKKFTDIILICGRYEGVDERVKNILKAEEISLGPYVLTDGDVAAMVAVSSIARLIPGAIRLESLQEESHWNLLLKKEVGSKSKTLEYPHYTRPEVFTYKGKKYHVPKVLLSGDHKKIREWRKKISK